MGRSGDCADATAGMVCPPVSVVGVRASDNNGDGVGDDPVSRFGDGAGRGAGDDTCIRIGGVPALSSAKVSVSEPPPVPAAVSVAAPAARTTTASIGYVQARGPPPESGVVARDERLSVSRVVPAMAVEVAGRVVTYQEVTVVSLPEFECAADSPKPVAAVLVMTATAVLAAVVAAPAPLLPQAGYGAEQPSLWYPPACQAAKRPKIRLRGQGSLQRGS